MGSVISYALAPACCAGERDGSRELLLRLFMKPGPMGSVLSSCAFVFMPDGLLQHFSPPSLSPAPIGCRGFLVPMDLGSLYSCA